MNENLLQTIDSIDNIIVESEMNVCFSLMEEYNKMLTLLEYVDEDICSEMTIFQEAATDKKKDDNTKSKKEGFLISTLKKLGRAIASLFKMLIDKIRDIAQWIGSRIKPAKDSLADKICWLIDELRGENYSLDQQFNAAHVSELKDLERVFLKVPISYENLKSKTRRERMKKSAEDLIELLKNKEEYTYISRKGKRDFADAINTKKDNLIKTAEDYLHMIDKFEKEYGDYVNTRNLADEFIFVDYDDLTDAYSEIKSNLYAITMDLTNQPGSVKDKERYTELPKEAEIIEFILSYMFGERLQHNEKFKQLSKEITGHGDNVGESIKPRVEGKELQYIIKLFKNIPVNEKNIVSYEPYQKLIDTLCNDLDKFRKDRTWAKVYHYEFKVSIDNHWNTSLKEHRPRIESVRFYHMYNGIASNLYNFLDTTRNHYKADSVAKMENTSELMKWLKHCEDTLDDIADDFTIPKDRGDIKELPYLKTSIFDDDLQLFDSVYEGLYNNDKISSDDKKKVFQYIQSNILIRAQKYTSFLSLFYTDLSKTLNEVFKSIHSFNEENIK